MRLYQGMLDFASRETEGPLSELDLAPKGGLTCPIQTDVSVQNGTGVEPFQATGKHSARLPRQTRG